MKFGRPERISSKLSENERVLAEENRLLEIELEARKRDSLEDGLKQWDDEITIERQKKQLERDLLTGAASLAEFSTQLEQALKMVRRGTPAALVYVDIDHFKSINDTYGHQGGDIILKKVAAFLMHSVRESDVVARIGGEEFAVLLVGSDGFSVQKAEQLRAGIAELTFKELPELDSTITASFGVVSLDTALDAATARERADKAMYEAKRAGRNQVKVYSET